MTGLGLSLGVPGNRKPKASANGDIVGPAGATDGNFAAFDTTTGKKLKDSGSNSSSFATAAQGGKADSALQPAAIGSTVQAFAAVLQATTASFTTTLETKIAGIAAGAEVNVNADWNAGSGDALILNKPTLGTAASKNTGVAAGNVPLLDGSGLLDTAVLPAIAVTDINVVGSQAAMLALTAQKGDFAVRTDLNKTFGLATNSPTTLADWKELLTPTDAVLSVAGLTGAISAAALKTSLAIAVADVTDMTANGRSLVQAANYATMFGLLKQNATTAATGVVQFATTAQYIANTASLGLTTDQVWAAAVPVAGGNMTGATTVDFSTFVGASRKNAITGNVTLGATSNIKKGHSFVWEITQDATGSRTLSLNSTYWETAGAAGITLSTAASAKDILTGYIQDNGKVLLSIAAKAVA